MKKKKLAIIGASTGQIQLCQKAKQMGNVETYCFAWSKGAVCKDIVDHFYPISLLETDKIVEKCLEIGIDGVVSNASEFTAQKAAYIAEKLGLVSTNYQTLLNIQDKNFTRQQTSNVKGLSQIFYKTLSYSNLLKLATTLELEQKSQSARKEDLDIFPCVVKPVHGAAKKGVNFVDSVESLIKLDIPEDLQNENFLIEQYISGQEISVEVLSFKGKHHVIQITDKITTGAPHFVELGHKQPSELNDVVKRKIEEVVPRILSAVGYTDGASHIEMKISSRKNSPEEKVYSEDFELYLIEINPRGGGDMISNRLVEMTTNCDYISEIINISLGLYKYTKVENTNKAAIYFICSQNKDILDIYNSRSENPLIVDAEYNGESLNESISNYDRNGFVLMQLT